MRDDDQGGLSGHPVKLAWEGTADGAAVRVTARRRAPAQVAMAINTGARQLVERPDLTAQGERLPAEAVVIEAVFPSDRRRLYVAVLKTRLEMLAERWRVYRLAVRRLSAMASKPTAPDRAARTAARLRDALAKQNRVEQEYRQAGGDAADLRL